MKLARIQKMINNGIVEVELGVLEIRRIVLLRFFNGYKEMVRVI